MQKLYYVLLMISVMLMILNKYIYVIMNSKKLK